MRVLGMFSCVTIVYECLFAVLGCGCDIAKRDIWVFLQEWWWGIGKILMFGYFHNVT